MGVNVAVGVGVKVALANCTAAADVDWSDGRANEKSGVQSHATRAAITMRTLNPQGKSAGREVTSASSVNGTDTSFRWGGAFGSMARQR